MLIDVQINTKSLKKLRKLRLWHWREGLSHRHHEQLSEQRSRNKAYESSWPMFEALAKVHKCNADFHIGMVQMLNDFFPRTGDTAEADDSLTQLCESGEGRLGHV